MPNTNFQTFHQMGQAINEVVRQATGRDAVQNIDMDHVTVAQNSYYEEVTASGSMVSFTDRVGNIPLEKCVVQIEPVQDLHGYSKPWAGGAGKNLFAGFPQSPGTALRYYSLNIGNGTFTMSTTTPLQSETSAANLFILPGQVATGANTAANGVSVGVPRTVISVDGYITIAYRNANEVDPSNYDIQIEQGSTATEYEPYSNICPITGWTRANIYVSPTTDAQDGTTYSITFPAEAGTVYGGTLDVIHGIILVDRIGVTLDGSTDENWVADGNNTTNGKRFYIQGVIHTKPVANNNTITTMKSNMFSPRTANQTWTGTIGISQSTNGMELEVLPGGCTTVEDLRAFLSANNLEIVYEIVTPIEYQLTAQEVTTLLGQNNIWADTGDIEVKYKVLKEMY